MTTATALAAATRMGERRGRLFAETGLPARNPFQGVPGSEDLAQAWRRAYFAASAPTPPVTAG